LNLKLLKISTDKEPCWKNISYQTGDDLERLKAGREGVLRGFKEAEKSWNGSLPDISHETLAKSLEAIDEKIRELGGSVVDLLT